MWVGLLVKVSSRLHSNEPCTLTISPTNKKSKFIVNSSKRKVANLFQRNIFLLLIIDKSHHYSHCGVTVIANHPDCSHAVLLMICYCHISTIDKSADNPSHPDESTTVNVILPYLLQLVQRLALTDQTSHQQVHPLVFACDSTEFWILLSQRDLSLRFGVPLAC